MPSDFRNMELKNTPTVPDAFSKPAMTEKLNFPCHIDHAVIGLMDPAHGPLFISHGGGDLESRFIQSQRCLAQPILALLC